MGRGRVGGRGEGRSCSMPHHFLPMIPTPQPHQEPVSSVSRLLALTFSHTPPHSSPLQPHREPVSSVSRLLAASRVAGSAPTAVTPHRYCLRVSSSSLYSSTSCRREGSVGEVWEKRSGDGKCGGWGMQHRYCLQQLAVQQHVLQECGEMREVEVWETGGCGRLGTACASSTACCTTAPVLSNPQPSPPGCCQAPLTV